MLHIGHKVTGLLLAPGGHVEDDRTLLAAAVDDRRTASDVTGERGTAGGVGGAVQEGQQPG
ncbi:hypothetical protein PQR15_37415 [Streptomyces lydicus]|nr:hypothetical protein [Streptomyces lydicus]